MKRYRCQTGLTLIELMIAVSVLTVLLMAGMPSFNEWMASLRIRTVGESMVAGLNLARTEAVKQNTRVVFDLQAGGPGWSVQLEGSSDPDAEPLARSEFGATTVVATPVPAAASRVTFNGFGQPVGASNLTQLDLSIPTAAGARSLRVLVGGGGIKLCDPHVASGDPRAC